MEPAYPPHPGTPIEVAGRTMQRYERTVELVAIRRFKLDGITFTPKLAGHLLDRGQARRPLRHARRTNGRVNQSERG